MLGDKIVADGEKLAGELGHGVIVTYMAHEFLLIVLDSTKNVRAAWAITCLQWPWPWIMNCPDPCHILNLLVKDLIEGSKKYPKVKGFSDVLNYGKFHLIKEMEKGPAKRGIQKSRDTCAAMMLKFKGKRSQVNRKHLSDSDLGYLFMGNLRTIIRILDPIEKGPQTLEGQNTTLLDVFYVFIGIGVQFTRCLIQV
ncbi:hypothetical protein L218DRAFT_948673 [Marasmius fiardii PR-910]|nr:hypothetical protein L218DRAFT_948673 [Marasmius fiardii PR-910]